MASATPWSAARAEEHLLAREVFGMRFGLERMRRLLTALGSPQERFRSIHVVGTNGKSSTVRMIAAILERHGVRSGAYLSPHLVRFSERIEVGGLELDGAAFGAAIARAARAAELVERALDDDQRVTQFELLTAACYDELARSQVEVAVVEAGLGGRYDATNVIPSSVQVLTNVGLEHTRFLGPTLADVAREKLAVVRDSTPLVVGPLAREVEAPLRETVERHGSRLRRLDADATPARVAGLAGYQRLNFALARAAAEELLGGLDEHATAAAAAAVSVPGRLETIDRNPLTIVDGAHNPDGVTALIASLPEVLGSLRPVGVVSILDDKDAAVMLGSLARACARILCTSCSNPRALSPATLASLIDQLGGGPAEIEPLPLLALRRARELAGPAGAVLVTGSTYLVADVVGVPGERRASAL